MTYEYYAVVDGVLVWMMCWGNGISCVVRYTPLHPIEYVVSGDAQVYCESSLCFGESMQGIDVGLYVRSG